MTKPVSSYFPNVVFYENGHQYINTQDPTIKYTSSTGVKKRFIPEFRRRYWIAWTVVKKKFKNRVCDYGGKCTADHFRINGKEYHMDVIWEKLPEECAEVARKWEEESNFGKDKGSSVHDYLENRAQRKVMGFKKSHRPWIEQAEEFWRKHDRSGVIFTECEVVVADKEKPVAGMIDRIDYMDGIGVRIVDYKSDKDLNDTNQYNKMLPPFDHLYQNPINEYSIQVNIYADIVERNTPWLVSEIILVNITDENWSVHKINRIQVLELL